MEDARILVELARSGQVKVAYPTFALAESLWEIGHRDSVRIRITSDLATEVHRLRRSASYEPLVANILHVNSTLRSIGDIERAELDAVIDDLLLVGRCIATQATTFTLALSLAREHDLTRQDAVILASIMLDLNDQPPEEPKWFVSRDRKGFSKPTIRTMLRERNATLLHTFADSVQVARRTPP